MSVGVDLSDVAPLPNWPEDPYPQHDTSPLSRMAQVWEDPEESATAVRPVPRLLVGVGVVLVDVPPLPNRPSDPRPQHETEPLSRMTHVWENPEESVVSVKIDPSWKPGSLSCESGKMTLRTSFWSERSVVSALFNPPVAAEIPRKIMRTERRRVFERTFRDLALVMCLTLLNYK